jgi:prepilin-type N-terminal cleavage/methylation domain-containing protein
MRAKKNLIQKTQGFTLVELLITIGIVALLSITAITGLIKTQDQFAFRGAVKSSANIVRELRGYALANKTVPEEVDNPDSTQIVPYRYGAFIDLTKMEIVIFADMPTPAINRNEYNAPGEENHDCILKTYTLPDVYKYEIYNAKVQTPLESLTLFYEPTNADFFWTSELPGKIDERFLAIRIFEIEKPDRENFIVLFELAGNPETFNSLDDL